MRSLLVLSLVLLTGCATSVPVVPKFPDVPDTLLIPCPALEQLPEQTKLSEVDKVVARNYATYYQCAVNNDGWIDWYNSQKKIFNNIPK
jgi:hypothetical protein